MANGGADPGNKLLLFNGVNGSTGDYLLDPMNLAQLTGFVTGADLGANHPLNLLKTKFRRDQDRAFGLSDDVDDPSDLAEAGWGVIFPAGIGQTALDSLRGALKPLLDLRQEQASKLKPQRYREFSGTDGYQPGDSAADWLARHGKSAADAAEPDLVPYYLMLVGSPAAIPFVFQYQLDVVYGVGRLYFDPAPADKPEDVLARYARYAQTMVAAERALESGQGFRSRRAVYFGVRNADNDATALSADQLVKPLFDQLSQKRPEWRHELVTPADARKDKLGHLFGDDAPGLLFTASHGMGFNVGDPRQERHQGALLCGDWPGREEWHDPIPESFYFSADDVSATAALNGMISFHFACYGAGTPQVDDFAVWREGANRTVAAADFMAHLPQRLLGHEKGGPLALIGHIDRAWDYSFSSDNLQAQTGTFRDTLSRLMRGERAGWATELFNSRYAVLSTNLTSEINSVKQGRIPDDMKLVSLWTANNDARSYVIIGDPAARLPLATNDAAPPAPPNLTFTAPVVIHSTPAAPTVATSTTPAQPADHFDAAQTPAAPTDLQAIAAQLQSLLQQLAGDGNTILISTAANVAAANPASAEALWAIHADIVGHGPAAQAALLQAIATAAAKLRE